MPPERRKTEAKETGRLINDNGGAECSAVVVLFGFGRRIPAAGLFEIEQRPVFEDRLLGYALEVFALFGRKAIVQSVW